MKKELILAILLLFSYIFVGCSKDEPEPKPEEPEIPTEPTEPETPVIDLYPELPEGATEVPDKFFSGKYARLPLPSTLNLIRWRAFYACLNDVVVIPEGVEEIQGSGLAKGHDILYTDHTTYDVVEDVFKGNVKKIYLPKTVKKLGEDSLEGVWVEHYPFHFYRDNPDIIMAGDYPPKGFMSAIWYNDNLELYPQRIYVPESGIENYVKVRDEEFVREDGSGWGYETGVENIKINSYQPVSIEITGGADTGYTYSYEPTSENIGVIKKVRWDISDPSIAKIDKNGVLEPLKTGKTHVQCIVSTPTSDFNYIEFYFFKPLEVTAEMVAN